MGFQLTNLNNHEFGELMIKTFPKKHLNLGRQVRREMRLILLQEQDEFKQLYFDSHCPWTFKTLRYLLATKWTGKTNKKRTQSSSMGCQVVLV